jgi:hypothetical protein
MAQLQLSSAVLGPWVGSASPIRLVFRMLVTKLNLFLFSRIAMLPIQHSLTTNIPSMFQATPHSLMRHIVSHDCEQGQWYVWARNCQPHHLSKSCQKRLVPTLAVSQFCSSCAFYLPSCFNHRAVDDGYKKMEVVATVSCCPRHSPLCTTF